VAGTFSAKANGKDGSTSIVTALKLSVIIPTHNRKAILQRAIRAYGQQTLPPDTFEVLIVDDGSTDGTPEVVSQCAMTSPASLRCLGQENRGQAAARNHGISEARGCIILFADDDVIPAPDMLEEHLSWHNTHPRPNFAVLGYIDWAPEVCPTPFMRWLSHAGPYSSYGYLRPGQEASVGNFYTGNASVKLEFLRKAGLFDEAFQSYGMEDAELGYRLFKNGMRLLYNPGAVGYHWKHVTFADASRRLRAIWAAREIVARKEAGIELTRRWAHRKNSRSYQRKLLLLRAFMPLIMPLSFILDSQIPMPAKVYQAFYDYQDYLAGKSRH
jgi:glycosyltransferase involved in cell wall biosynthesis